MLAFALVSNLAIHPERWVTLRELHDLGRVLVLRGDGVDSELIAGENEHGHDPSVREAVTSFREVLGPFTVGMSRIGFGRIASEVAARRAASIRTALWPHMQDTESRTSHRRLFDVHHVVTAIENGLDGLVTDDALLIRRAIEAWHLLGDFRVLTPNRAVDWVMMA